MKKLLRLGFGDFWESFDPRDNLFTRLLRLHYDLEIDQRRPDLLIYTPYSELHRQHRCRKIFWTSERDLPDYRDCHASLTFEPSTRENLYFPVWLMNHEPAALAAWPRDFSTASAAAKDHWCLFLVSNPSCQDRIDLFHAFARHRHVDSPGKVCNNMPALGGDARDPASTVADPQRNWHARKLSMMGRYRFNLACENQASPGYITEKIFDALVAGVVPIYWGARDIADSVNPDAFIHARDFPDFDALARHVLALDDDPERYLAYLRAPIFPGGKIPERLTFDFLAGRLAELVEEALARAPIGAPFSFRVSTAAHRVRNRVRRALGHVFPAALS